MNQLKNKLNETQKVKEFIAGRRQLIKDQLSKFSHLPASLKKQYEGIQKTVYYYSAQVKEYREMLHDPKKIEEKAIALLRQMTFFQKFMQQHSRLASLFRLPGTSPGMNGNPVAALAGLQTRASVQGMIQQRITAGGPNARAVVQQNLAAAQSQLSELKKKLLSMAPSSGAGLGEAGIPDFKPNNQKTKPFLKRLEYSANVQFAKSNNLLPSTANIGIGIGYKLDDTKSIGIGMAYKIGMGTINHIQFTSQGVGLRSYAGWKFAKKGIFKNISIMGGYEMNYNSAFKNIEQLKDYAAWQRSALIGISRKVGSIPSPFRESRKGAARVQLLYDFLAREHVPMSQPFIFRMGYNF